MIQRGENRMAGGERQRAYTPEEVRRLGLRDVDVLDQAGRPVFWWRAVQLGLVQDSRGTRSSGEG